MGSKIIDKEKLSELTAIDFVGGPSDNTSIYMALEGRLSEDHTFIVVKDGQYYMYKYDDVMNVMIYVEQVYMNEEGVIEYGC